MSDPALGLLMLTLIVIVIMMGFPTAFTLMGLGMFFGFIAFYVPGAILGRQPRVRFDGRAHLRRDDQRRADLDPVIRLNGLRDGARRAGRQDVLLDPAGVPESAGLARRRHADRVHVLGHRQRPGGRGGGADGRHRVQSDAQGGIRREARLRRHHGGRHARHPDSAVGHDHRLCGGRRSVDRQAIRGGDVPRLLPVVPVPRLYRRLGDDQSEDRPAIAGRTNEGAGAGVAGEVRGRLSFANHPDLADQGAALAVEGQTDRRGRPSRQLLDAALKSGLRAGAVHDRRRLDGNRLVVRRYSPASCHRTRGNRRAATGHSRAE